MAIEFNTEFYLQSKFNQLEEAGQLEEFGLTDVASLEQYFADNNVDAEEHYLNSGMEEGINPSPEFDTNAYLNAKLEQLQGEEFEGQYANLTVEGLIEIFQENGLTALDHYNQYGINEEIEASVPAEAVEGAAFDLTSGTDTLVASDAELEEGEEAVRTTELNDTINGVASALSAQRTLDTSDSIDGGEGEDTLNVSVNSSFTGFTGEGGVQNVENIVLTNEGTIARNFNATGIEGAEQYTLNGGVNLVDLEEAGVTVAVADRTADLNVGFTDEAVEGDEDALTLALENVGTVATDDDDADAMGITATEVEALTVNVEGENVVNLTNAAQAESLTVTGAGDLTVEGVGAALKTVDASAAEGAVSVSLANATGVTSVEMGAGDDTIQLGSTANSSDNDLTANASINGGEGNDRLVLNTNGTVQYAMAGIETIALGNLTGDLTFSARDVEGLQTIESNGQAGDATFARLGGTDLAFDLKGASADNAASIQADHSGASTVNVTGGAEADAEDRDTSNTDLTFTNSNNVVLNVADNADYAGELIANRASAIEADIQGQLTAATVNASRATSANITTGEDASSVVLNTAALTDLNIVAGGAFTIADDSNVAAVEGLTVETAGIFTATEEAFSSINQVNLSGNGSVALGTLGDDTNANYGVTVNAEGLAGGLTIADAEVGQGQAFELNAGNVLGDVTVTAAGVSGAVVLGTTGANNALEASDVTISAEGALSTVNAFVDADTATVTGSGLGVNNLTVTAAESATVTGGIADDIISVTADAEAATDVVEFTLTGDLGDDAYTFTATTGAVRATITDFADADAVATFLENALSLTANSIADGAITAAYSDDVTGTNSFDDGIFVYGGNVHIVEDSDTNDQFNDGDTFITLAGVSSVADEDAVFA
ncbi:beta strand repeat-containing protein [Halomonas sp. MES3-P3E]|uniref:beta strand repeat-containing protein n=1 Tax=Halomonas sp. MES3-P3E TaxID=2058321 RepID=UPI000C343C86|nr:hypothetical protein [Halomonas sp. MES3-P3E]PKG54785.1 hypothetical protein CXF87_01280 [Halomonas sp. MES3-P3E]